jgi:hypothetical protein
VDRPRIPGHPDVLGHVRDPAAQVDVALLGLELTGQAAQQRALADAVDPDEPRVPARPQAERDAAEEQVAARVRVGQVGDDERAHVSRT